MMIKNIGQESVTITNDGFGDITISPDETVNVDDEVGEYLKSYKSFDSSGNAIQFIEV